MPSNELVAVENQLNAVAPQLSQALAGTMPAEKLIRTILVSVERTPKLLNCNRQSLMSSAMSAAVLGLEVDGTTGQAYLLPFKDRAQLVIGYKGYNTLAARAGITITGSIVRTGDDFDYDIAQGFITHKPKLDGGGRIIGAWAKAAAKDRPPVVMVMGIRDLEAVKARSPGAKRNDSPWNDPAIGFPAMCEKTVKRRLARSLPLTVMSAAAALDEAVEERGMPASVRPGPEGAEVLIEGEVSGAVETPETNDLIPPTGDVLYAMLEEEAKIGVEALQNAWDALLKPQRQSIGADGLAALKALAESADDVQDVQNVETEGEQQRGYPISDALREKLNND